MRPGIALAGMAALLLAMLGRMGALDWVADVLPVIVAAGGAVLIVALVLAVGVALLMVPALAITAALDWAWPATKPGKDHTA